jgi:hypothetical protein
MSAAPELFRSIHAVASAAPAAWSLSATRKLSTLAVTSVNSILSQAPTCFRIGSKVRCIQSKATEMQSMSENNFECFAIASVNSL